LVSLALNVDIKWLDNLLSHYAIEGTHAGRRGVARQLGQSAVELVAVVRTLAVDLGLSVAESVRLAPILLSRGATDIGQIQLRIDVSRLRAELAQNLEEAMGLFEPARRGRPPKSSADGRRPA